MTRPIRKVRHWKQRWDPSAPMIFRRRVRWGDRAYEPGDPIPDDLAANRRKLRNFWEASWIELAGFIAPDVATGQVEAALPEGVIVEQRGSWYYVTTPGGEQRVRGKDALQQLLASYSENCG